MKSYRVSILPSHPQQKEKTDFDRCIVVVPKDYDGAGPMPRYTDRPNLPQMLTRLGIDEGKRHQIEEDITAGRAHHIAELAISDEQVSEFWWQEPR